MVYWSRVSDAVTDAILVVNAGSSSVKFALFDVADSGREPARRFDGEIDGLGAQPRFTVQDASGATLVDEAVHASGGRADHARAIGLLLDWVHRDAADLRLVAAGHRVVHGGDRFSHPVRVDRAVLDALDGLVPLAPLHEPHNLAGIRAVAALQPDLPQVACFDTAFHRTQPWVAETFALPRALSDAGIKRYGFHGLSYEHVARVLPALVGARADGRVIVAHLGAGASMTAIKGGASIATTMGFTALDGLPMGTRPGTLDPGVILYLLAERAMTVAELTELLYHRSGLLGVSGVSADVRALLADPSDSARDAIDLFVYRVGRELGSLAAALGGLDALVFTGGIGEHADLIRARVCRDAGWLGVTLDERANERHGPRISRDGSRVSAWVVPTDEELVIARHTVTLTRGAAP
jgi:acetate kinase